jgi:hypothetical protein
MGDSYFPDNLYLNATDVQIGISGPQEGLTGTAEIFNDQVTFFGSNVTIKQGLKVEGTITLGNIQDTVQFEGSISVAGSENVGSSLVRGNAKINGSLSAATIGSTGDIVYNGNRSLAQLDAQVQWLFKSLYRSPSVNTGPAPTPNYDGFNFDNVVIADPSFRVLR